MFTDSMKRFLLIFVATAVPALCCNAQLKAPVQYDTLAIRSMQYHFDEIRPENWPFRYVVRTATSFIFGGQEIRIKSSSDYGSYKEFCLEYGEYSLKSLKLREDDSTLTLDFDGYLLLCSKPESSCEMKTNTRRLIKSIVHLSGRTVDKAGLKKPAYESQESGTVVVEIWVDQYGQVTKAVAGADGTTAKDQTLWAASRKAALDTHFNMDGEAPVLQEGMITYVFGSVETE